MRKKIIAGNWKMNLNLREALALVAEINNGASKSDKLESVLIFPPFPFITELCKVVTRNFIHLGSQNVSSESSGAYTGEVSAAIVKSVGAGFTLIGHSERRIHFNESNDLIRKKVDLSLAEGLSIVLCCGESLSERQGSKQEKIVEMQLVNSLFHLKPEKMSNVYIAYEPVWAIGSGQTASPAQAQEMHFFIRNLLNRQFGNEVSSSTRILYGGSCNASNAGELFANEDIDGGLIGGASLKSEEFLKIIDIVNG